MTFPDLTATLDSLGITLDVRLVIDAPRGAVTPEIKATLSEYKAALLYKLVRDLQWERQKDQRWGPARDDSTPGIIIDTPDPAKVRAAIQALHDDPDDEARAERVAIAWEATGCPDECCSSRNKSVQ